MERLTDRQLAANILETTAVPRLKRGKPENRGKYK